MALPKHQKNTGESYRDTTQGQGGSKLNSTTIFQLQRLGNKFVLVFIQESFHTVLRHV
jgi:hypothetical protein